MIKGEVHLIFKDVNTGEITRELKENNTVTATQFAWLANTGPDDTDNQGRFGRYIFIGGGAQQTNWGTSYLHDQYAVGVEEAGISQPRYLSGNVGDGGTFAYYYEYQQRFNPPASTRTITTIAINRWDWTTGNLNYQRPLVPAAWLSLSSACTQTPTETLDVFYRIIWNNPDPLQSGLNNAQMDVIARRAMNNDTGSFVDFQYEYPADDLAYLYQGQKMVPYIDGRRLSSAFVSQRPNAGVSQHIGYYTRGMTTSISLTDSLGRIYGTAALSDDGDWNMCIFTNPILKDFSIDSPIGNIFPHSTSATGPFYQSTGVATGDATISVDGSGWTNPDFNKILQVEITNSGTVGTAEYRLYAMNTTGFYQNTYRMPEVSLPLIHSWQSYQGYSMFDIGSNSKTEYNGPHAMPYGDHPTTMIVFRENWIGKMDVMTGYESERHHGSSSVPFTGSQINQIVTVPNNGNEGALIPGDVWIADETTGLHRLHEDESTIEIFNTAHADLSGLTSSACRGVTFTPGRIWAAFDGGLAYTDDNGTTFTVYDGTTTPTFTATDYERIWFIQGDPQDVNHHLGIAYNEEPTLTIPRPDLRLYWWDPTSGFGNSVNQLLRHTSQSNQYPWKRLDIFNAFTCSPDDSVWGNVLCETNSHYPAMYTYNSTGPFVTFGNYSNSNFINRYNFSWQKDLSGQDAMLVAWFDFSNFYFGFHLQSGTSHRSDVISNSQYQEDTANVIWSTRTNEGVKCILPSGMMILTTARNSNNGSYRFWLMRPAWVDADDPFGGQGKYILGSQYGWNGSAWEKDHPGSKTTHAAAEAAIEGLTIAFDDDGATQSFVTSDYHTVPVIDGILADGATEFSHTYNLYYKRAIFDQSAIENGGILTGASADYGHGMGGTEKLAVGFIDSSNLQVTNHAYLQGVSASNPWYARFNHVHTDRAYVIGRFDSFSGIPTEGFIIGFSDASKIGSAPSTTNIDYGIKISPGVLGSSSGLRVEVISNGSVITVVDDGSQGFQTNDLQNSNDGYGNVNRNNEDYCYFALDRASGSTDLEVSVRGAVVHTFTGVTSNLVITWYMDNYSGAWRFDGISTTKTDTIMKLGTPAWNEQPDFYAIDLTAAGRPRPDEVKLNGVPVTTLYYNDRLTTLATGEVDIMSNGYVRYAAADVGKTLTIDRYNALFIK